jgi:hypothetical protein
LSHYKIVFPIQYDHLLDLFYEFYSFSGKVFSS